MNVRDIYSALPYSVRVYIRPLQCIGLSIILACGTPAHAANTKPKEKTEQTEEKAGKKPFALFDQKQQKAPTYVSAEKLTVDNIKRVFEYSGDVEVIQADMILTCKRLVGTYSQDNQIQTMTAYEDVMVTKGETVRASGNRADYDGVARTLVLTENPELQQQGSILTADRVKVFLNENRSVAEGSVRVKLANKQ